MKPEAIKLSSIQLYGHLDANYLQKLSPEEYMKKFGSHLQILEFQKKLLKPQPGKVKFIKRSNTTQIVKSQVIQSKTKISKFAHVQETIIHDRAQITRFKSIAKSLTENINNHQVQAQQAKRKLANQIKIFNENHQIETKVIDDMTIMTSRQTHQEIKQQLQKRKSKQIFCKFIKRDRSKQGKNSYKSRFQWPEMRTYHSERKMNNHFIKQQHAQTRNLIQKKSNSVYHPSLQKKEQFFTPNQSQIEEIQSKDRILLSTFNTTKKCRLKSSSQMINASKIINKRDLVEQTKKLKDSKNQIKSIFYSKEVGKKIWQKIGESIHQNSQNQFENQNGLLKPRNQLF